MTTSVTPSRVAAGAVERVASVSVAGLITCPTPSAPSVARVTYPGYWLIDLLID